MFTPSSPMNHFMCQNFKTTYYKKQEGSEGAESTYTKATLVLLLLWIDSKEETSDGQMSSKEAAKNTKKLQAVLDRGMGQRRESRRGMRGNGDMKEKLTINVRFLDGLPSSTWISGLAKTKSLGSIWDTGLELRKKAEMGDSYKCAVPIKIKLAYTAMRVNETDL